MDTPWKQYNICTRPTLRSKVDFSQSPIFSWDRLDKPRLTVMGILIFKCTEGAGVRNYSSKGGRGGGGGGVGRGEKNK